MGEPRFGPQILCTDPRYDMRRQPPRLCLVRNDPAPVSVAQAPEEKQAAQAVSVDLDAAFREIWAEVESEVSGHEEAAKIVVASLICGPHPLKIAAMTGIRRYRVRRFAAKLYDNGCWTHEGKIAISYDMDDPEKENLLLIEIILHAMAAEDVICQNKPERKESVCCDCQGPRHTSGGRRCRSCFRARAAILNS